MARRRLCNGFAARGGQPCVGGPTVVGRGLTFGQATLAHTPQLVRYAATLPADLGGQIGDPHPRVRRVAQRDEDVVIGQRQAVVDLQLAMHLVIHPKLHTDVGKPGTLLDRREPPRLTSSLRRLRMGHGVAFSRWRRHRGAGCVRRRGAAASPENARSHVVSVVRTVVSACLHWRRYLHGGQWWRPGPTQRRFLR